MAYYHRRIGYNPVKQISMVHHKSPYRQRHQKRHCPVSANSIIQILCNNSKYSNPRNQLTEMIRLLNHEPLKAHNVDFNLTTPISDNESNTASKVIKTVKAARVAMIVPEYVIQFRTTMK